MSSPLSRTEATLATVAGFHGQTSGVWGGGGKCKGKQLAEEQSREVWRGCSCDSQVAEGKKEGKIRAGEARKEEREEASADKPAHGLEET